MAAHSTTAWHHMRRSPYQSLAAILIIVLTFFTISLFTLLIFGSYKIINIYESRPQVQIFFKPETKKEDIDGVKKQLETTGKIAKIKYTSKEEALAIFKKETNDDPLMQEFVTSDILPPSLGVSTTNLRDLPGVVDAVKGLPIVQRIGYYKDVINQLTSWTDALRKVGIAMIAVLGIESILIMTTIISIKISQRREEIELMRLIGATNMYISSPYVYEGIFYSIAGTIVGWGIACAGLLYYTPAIVASNLLKDISLLPVDPLFL